MQHKKLFRTYAEIEDKLGMNTSDAQGYAEANPEMLWRILNGD